MDKIETIIKEIFKGNEAQIKSRLLGGMMNETYIVSHDKKNYVLFVPQGNANEIVNREEEKFVQNIAYNLGITSKNIYFNTTNGIKCHEFIEGQSLNKTEDFDYDKISKLIKWT